MVDVSIVIVTYNSLPEVEDCLVSIFRFTEDVTYEVIVVDNNSPDRNCLSLERKYPNVRFLFLPTNNGFGAGCNMGLSLSSGKHVLFLNPDTVLVENSLKSGVEFMNHQPAAGVISFMIVDERRVPQMGFGDIPNIRNELLLTLNLEMLVRRWSLLRKYRHQITRRSPFLVDWVAGACMLVRRTVLQSVGAFDESFFLFYEDVDLCVRVRAEGWQVYYVPTTTLVHRAGHSTGRNHYLLVTSRYRSKLLYAKKHLSLFGRLSFSLLSAIGLVIRLLATMWPMFGSPGERNSRRRGYRESLAYCVRFHLGLLP